MINRLQPHKVMMTANLVLSPRAVDAISWCVKLAEQLKRMTVADCSENIFVVTVQLWYHLNLLSNGSWARKLMSLVW